MPIPRPHRLHPTAALMIAALVVATAACGPSGTAQVAGDPTTLPTLQPPGHDVTMTDYMDFSEVAPVTEGGLITLSTEIAEGPVVLVFYRGHWCDACRTHLGELQDYVREFEQRGARLIAVSADRPEDVRTIVESQGLTFPVLSDEDLSTIEGYGLREADQDFALPATLIIAPDGSVVYRRVGTSVTDRPTVEELLRELERISPTEDAPAPSPD